MNTFLSVLSSIGIAILAMVVLYVLNFQILGKSKAIKYGNDGYHYRITARHYSKAMIFLFIEMFIILVILMTKSSLNAKLSNALGISMLITVAAIIVTFILNSRLKSLLKDFNEKEINERNEEARLLAFDAKEDEYSIPGFIIMTITDGVLITVLLSLLKII